MFLQNKSPKAMVNLDALIAEFRKLNDIAYRLTFLYELLDQGHHDLARTTLNYEQRFRECFVNVYGDDTILKTHFAETVAKAFKDGDIMPFRKDNPYTHNKGRTP